MMMNIIDTSTTTIVRAGAGLVAAVATATDCDIQEPECFSPDTVDPFETDYAALVPRFTGSLSAISSTLIIYVILRSETRLSSIYHRIMFGMSLADICGSIAMALTSLPMPSYMPKEEIYGYKWAGTRLGNTSTCNAQGFFVSFGMTGMYAYNAMLCVYYACAVAFSIQERKLKKYVEPIIHAIPVIGGVVIGFLPILNQMYNPWRHPWCAATPYPIACSGQEDVECIRGSALANQNHEYLLSYLVILFFVVIVSSLVMVVWKVISTQRLMMLIAKRYGDIGFEDMQNVLKKHANAKVVLFQAVSYIAAFLLSLLPGILLLIGANGRFPQKTITEFEKLSLVLLPLQGFFNCVIFISHKVYNYRRTHSDTSIRQVLRLLFTTSTHDPLFISRISIVEQNDLDHEEEDDNDKDDVVEDMAVKEKVYQFSIQDESNEELLIYLERTTEVYTPTETIHLYVDDRSQPYEEIIDSNQESNLVSTTGGMDESGGVFSMEEDGRSCDFSDDGLSYPSNCTGTSLWNTGSSLEENTIDEQPPKKSYYKDCVLQKK